MICFRDRTFCLSPNCKNECGRQLSCKDKKLIEKLGIPVAYDYFCGMPNCGVIQLAEKEAHNL